MRDRQRKSHRPRSERYHEPDGQRVQLEQPERQLDNPIAERLRTALHPEPDLQPRDVHGTRQRRLDHHRPRCSRPPRPTTSKTGAVTITVNPTTTITTAQALSQSTASSTALPLSATVTGPTNTSVNWSLTSGSGALSASSTASGASVTYRPACVIAGGAAQTAQVKATSAADASKSLTFTVTVNAEAAGSRVTCGSDLASTKWARTTGLAVNRFAVADTTTEDSDGALDQFTVTNASSNNFLEHSPVTVADGERVTVSFTASGSGSINYTVRPDSCAPATENCEPYDLNNSGARGTAASPDYGDYSYITLTSTPTKYATTFTKASDAKPAKLVIGGINSGAIVNLGGAKVVPYTAPTVTGVSVAASSTTIAPSGQVTLTPTVTGTGSFSQTVNWTVSPTTAGSFSSTSSTGATTFTASGTVTNGSSITVTATSAVDGTKSRLEGPDRQHGQHRHRGELDLEQRATRRGRQPDADPDRHGYGFLQPGAQLDGLADHGGHVLERESGDGRGRVLREFHPGGRFEPDLDRHQRAGRHENRLEYDHHARQSARLAECALDQPAVAAA